MAFNINLNAINIGSVQNNAGVFTGENQQFGWDTHQKQSSNAFLVGTFNTAPYNMNIITDNDVFDTPIGDQDFKPGYLTQQL